MTNKSLIAAKKWYEEQLTTKLAGALGITPAQVIATWMGDSCKAVLNMNVGDLVSQYTLTYTSGNKNLVLEALTYKQLFTDATDDTRKQLTGIQAQPVNIDFDTMAALAHIMNSVLEMEYVVPEENVPTPAPIPEVVDSDADKEVVIDNNDAE